MSEDFRIQHSVKTRSGDMLNVRAADPAEFAKVLSYVRENIAEIAGLGDLIRAAEAAAGGGLNPTTVPQQQAPQQYAQPAVPAPAQSAPNPSSAPVCRHGAKKWRPPGISGPQSKNPGTPYEGFWACPGPRGDQCRKGE